MNNFRIKLSTTYLWCLYFLELLSLYASECLQEFYQGCIDALFLSDVGGESYGGVDIKDLGQVKQELETGEALKVGLECFGALQEALEILLSLCLAKSIHHWVVVPLEYVELRIVFIWLTMS